MKLTVMQQTMLVFLQHQKELTAWDFRNGLTYMCNQERGLFIYDFLPRQIHEIEKIKLPSGKRITFNRRKLKTKTGANYVKYSLDIKSYSVEDVLFMSSIKNIKKVNKLETKNSTWLNKFMDYEIDHVEYNLALADSKKKTWLDKLASWF